MGSEPKMPEPKFWWKPPTDAPMFYYNDSDVMRQAGFTALYTADQLQAYAAGIRAAVLAEVRAVVPGRKVADRYDEDMDRWEINGYNDARAKFLAALTTLENPNE